MKLRTKITLLTSLLLIGILLCVDIAVYSLFIKSATQNAGEMLLSKWEPVIEQGESMSTEAQDVLLYKSLTEDTLIRISIPGSVRTITNGADFDLNEVPVTDNRTKGTKLLQKDDERILMVYIPVETVSGDMGGFEIAEKMDDLETNLKILVTILTSTTFGAVLLCMLGGSMLSRTVVRPITSSIRTMREIERSLAFMKISYKGKNRDELYEMTETFNRMMERLEESFWNQQQFVSDASHELNTTLMIIEGYSNMLRRWGAHDKKVQEEAVKSIYEETKRMRIMTQQLLNLASSQQGGQFTPESVNLIQTCKLVIAHFSQLSTRKIILHSKEKDNVIQADHSKIKQLLIILLDNALKYSTAPVELHLTKQEEYVQFIIKDYGIGIPQGEVKHVFERFYRIDSSRHRKTGGTGLGLPIAKSIVEEHHGEIRIESHEGAGTEVIVKLPTALSIRNT
ncbi:two-component sensor histidine kinase [Paenibacillus helianthi]|uniref:histidine kinase n=1 Tax=Paenibacillus helianthi TaxID=1349432 RepID=A0ABX3EPU0_9BACL|nr:HAMP domain-containing sensor histidine kinase [Paenibacillus helianthi]OKP87743.1 two-component sensor histidine kinase [Paenibacillus helianthi]